jgi:spermidine synthase
LGDGDLGECYDKEVTDKAQTRAGAQRSRMKKILFAGFFLSGVAGLVDEVVWSKYLAGLLGSTTVAHTIVLATFMAGLALGNATFGRRSDRGIRLIKLYALLEIAIGAFCLFFPEVFNLFTSLYISAAQPLGADSAWIGPLKMVTAGCTILIPTFLMGGTLPVLARGIVEDIGDVTAGVGRLYFINSLGAVVGVGLGGFYLIPTLGLDVSIRLSAAINLLLGFLFLFWDRHLEKAGRSLRVASSSPELPEEIIQFTPRTQRIVLIVIGLSGAASMLYEVAWTRLLSLVLGSSSYSFTIMLLTFILGITLGSLAVSKLFSNPNLEERPNPLVWLAIAEIAVFATILPILPIYDELPFAFATIASILERTPENFGLYLTIKVVVCLVLMFLPTFFIGMTLPLASRIAVNRMEVLGKGVGSVFSVNIMGGVIGTILTGLWLIPTLELWGTLVLGMGLSLALGLTVLWISPGLPSLVRRGVPTACILLFALVVGFFGEWDRKLLNYGIYRHKDFAFDSVEELQKMISPLELLYARDGRDSSVAVIKDTRTDNIYLKVNGKTDAGTGQDMATQLWLGHLGMLLHPDARDTMVIGLGSGITPAAILRHPDTTVDVVEISEAVVEAADYFKGHNYDVLRNPRLSLHVTDAKEYFHMRPDTRYDLIVSEPSNPWMAGIGGLFSKEYFEELREHLAEDGLVVQWLHLYELNDTLARVILNTMTSVFENVEVWDAYGLRDVLVVASKQPVSFDMKKTTARLQLPQVLQDLNRPHLPLQARSTQHLLDRQILSNTVLREEFPGVPPFNTDLKPILEYEAPKAFFANERSEILVRLDERRKPLLLRSTHGAKHAVPTPR